MDYVVNPSLVRAFEHKQLQLAAVADDVRPVLCFHGTAQENIDSICRNGFWVPGQASEFQHATSTGVWGRGESD